MKEPKSVKVTKKNVTGKPETKKTKKNNVNIVEPEIEKEPQLNELPVKEPKKVTKRKTKKNSEDAIEPGEDVPKKPSKTRKNKPVSEL